MEVKVSVIIPVYNVENYLERCLDSIINQTYNNLDIIIINDGSTDKSYSIAKSYANNDKRITLLNQKNQGQAKARNVGISICTGDYILFVDSDDWIEKNCVQKCLDSVLRTKSELVVFDIRLFKQNEIKYENFDLTIFNSHSGPCNKFFSKQLWKDKKFPEHYWYEDLGVIPVIVGKCINKVKLNEALYNYDFTRQDSQSHQINVKKNNDILEMLELVYQEFKEYSPEIEYLFIKHLVLGLILRKATLVKNNKNRRYVIQNAFNYLEKRFPNWKKNKYYINNDSFLSKIEKCLVHLINYRQYALASLLWKSFNNLNTIRNLNYKKHLMFKKDF
ncbi:glycosyltransferase family 2 protein [Bacillus sp. mrc49]|uniref:glycosyltransferase family 2 protein n=1 Tax=Bacillus sp. mrc49 TaxID=2054913 RepID=UPI000C26EF76|nr:glycosyltransferase family 2 protein [Bacillus sp. mrc49]PJN89264.1 glycosyltransferase family 2 protein [Bacillus sp. mrc49]